MSLTVTGASFVGTTITLTTSAPLLTATLTPSLFTVTQNGSGNVVTAASASGSTITLTATTTLATTDTVNVTYANPAIPTAPTAPGQNYSIPGGGVTVTNYSSLKTAMANGTAQDIYLVSGNYTAPTGAGAIPFSAPHRLWANNALGPVLNVGMDIGNMHTPGAKISGLKFVVTDSTLLTSPNGNILENWGGADTVTIQDCYFDGGFVANNGFLGLNPNGCIVQRCYAQNFKQNGICVNDGNTSSAAIINTISDLEAHHCYGSPRGNSNGTSEFGVFIGHQVTNGINRIYVRDTGVGGLWIGNNFQSTTISDCDLDDAHGTAIGGYSAGLYVERTTHPTVTFQKFLIGSLNSQGIIGEWNHGFAGTAGMNTFVIKNGRINTAQKNDAGDPNKGIFADQGSDTVSGNNIVFGPGINGRCVGYYLCTNTTNASWTNCDWSQRASGAVRGATSSTSTANPLTEDISTDGSPPQRPLASVGTRDEVASATVGAFPPSNAATANASGFLSERIY